MATWLKNEFWTGYTRFEKIFLFSMVALQAIVYCFAPDSLIGMVCGIAGCICSLFFLSLLIIPGMPGYLSFQSRVVLLVWILIGFVFYLSIRKTYVKGQDRISA